MAGSVALSTAERLAMTTTNLQPSRFPTRSFVARQVANGGLAHVALVLVCLGTSSLTNRSAWGESIARPNVLFLLSDDQRPDTISALGNKHIETPNLDRLAKTGTTFTRAICSNPICTPSRAEIISGCDGWRSGISDFGGRFRDGLSFWPETMRRAGYHTTYVGKWHVRGRPSDYGFESVNGLYGGGGGRWWMDQTDWKGFPITGYRGWVFQSADGKTKYPDLGVGLTPNISEKFADAAIEVIEHSDDRPFFLQVNFTAPHDPLLAPPGFEGFYLKTQSADKQPPAPNNFLAQHPFDHGNLRGRDERLMHWPRTKAATRDVLAMYYRVISHLDKSVGKILLALERSGKAKNTIVIYSSDHGLGVGSHGLRGKQSMYEHTIGVPLILVGPGVQANRRTPAQVYLRELFPTICDLCGIETPKSVQGRSFANVVRGESDKAHDAVFGFFRNSQRMIRTDRHKLIVYPEASRIQLFDLRADPDELNDVYLDQPETAAALLEQLQVWQREAGDPMLDKR